MPQQVAVPAKGGTAPRPREFKYGNREVYLQQFDDLGSYRSLAATYPNSWLWQCHRLDREFPEAPDLWLLVARELAELGRAQQAAAVASRLLAPGIGGGNDWYAMKAYGLLAEQAAAAGDSAGEVAAYQAALQLNSRNPFTHNRLATAYERLKCPNRARYHRLVSLALFPSQPALRAQLVAAGVLPAPAAAVDKPIEQLYEDASRAVVLIKQRVGTGSGFFITSDGMLLTNYHVIAGGEDVLRVSLLGPDGHAGGTLTAQVVAADPQLDIAILSVDAGELKIVPLVLATGADVKTGMKVIAIGNPGMGTQVLTRTVTEGIVSNVTQKVAGQEYIQTSAAVNPGNSGGPLLSARGEVLGMVTLKAQLDNVGFAIPAARLLKFLEDHLH